MKSRIAAIICLLILMALIPAAVVGMSGNNVKMTSSTPDTAVKSDDKSQTVINTAVSLCGKDFCDEALKAALIIAESNYLSGTKMKTNDNSSDKELYNRVEQIYNSNNEIYFTYNEKAVYIPCSPCSNGKTVKSDKYEYLSSVASPWDIDCASYSIDNKCEGVSIYGVNYLCEKGYSAEETLEYYLPKLKIVDKRIN